VAKGQNSPISYALLARKQILELLNRLKLNKEFVPEEILRIADLLQNYDEIYYPLIVKEFENADSEVLIQKYQFLLKYLDYPGFTPMLIELLQKKLRNYKQKKAILDVLKYYRVDFSAPQLKKYLETEEELIRKIKLKLLQSANADLNDLASAMQEFYILDENEMISLMRELVKEEVRAIPILDLMLRTGIKSVIFEAIRLLGRIKDSESMAVLNAAKLYLPPKFCEEIAKSIRKLRFMWVKKSKEQSAGFKVEKAYLSYPTEFLNRNLVFVVKQDAYNHLLFFNITKNRGIADFVTAKFYLSEAALKEIEEYYKNEFSLREVALYYAKSLLCDGVRKNYVNEIPFHPLFPVVTKFIPSNYICPFSYDPTTIKSNPEIKNIIPSLTYEITDELLEIIRSLNWLSSDGRFKDIVFKWYLGSDKNSWWLDELLIRKVLREIIIPNLYDWKEMLFLLADFMYNTGGKLELVAVFVELATSLNTNIEEMEQVRLLRVFITESKNIVLQNKEDWS